MPRSIGDFLSVIKASGGLAHQNLYRVEFSFPDGFPADAEQLELLCDSASIPGRSLSTIDFQAHKQVYKIAQGFTQEDASFSFILTNDYAAKRIFDAWMRKSVDFEAYRAAYREQYVADISIYQVTKGGEDAYVGRLEAAYPTSVSAIVLENSAENTIQRMTVSMAYENLRLGEETGAE